MDSFLDTSSVAVRGTLCEEGVNDPVEVDHVGEAAKWPKQAISLVLLYEPRFGVMMRGMLREVILIADEAEDKSPRRRQLSQLNRTADGASKLIPDSLLECLHKKQKRD